MRGIEVRDETSALPVGIASDLLDIELSQLVEDALTTMLLEDCCLCKKRDETVVFFA